MGVDKRATKLQNESAQAWSISLHTFSDLSHVSPLVFLYLLKEAYTYGRLKATAKFRLLQDAVVQALPNGPQPGPASFVAQLLYIIQVFDLYSDGFSHLVISAYCRFLGTTINQEDKRQAKLVAAKLFLDIIQHNPEHDVKVLVKIVEAFDVSLTDMEKIMQRAGEETDVNSETAQKFVESFVSGLIKSQSYVTAVSLLEHFKIYHQSGESFLLQMLQSKLFAAAEKWAAYVGKPMIQVLVEELVKVNELKIAYNIVKKNNMLQEYPDVCQQCKESELKKLAEKGCWDVAERKTKGDRQLLQLLVYLAMEAGYVEKVEELCTRYALEGFENVNKKEASLKQSCYLHLDDFCLEDVVWVDEVKGLRGATCHLKECKVIGLDCEWRPNYEKGSKPSKVSIMQIASESKVYILDLIKLCESIPATLDQCLCCILHSPRILKLGYNFQCDVQQLARSYPDLQCFKQYERLLDIQNVFKETSGGLSGLSKKVLGRGLNKTRRNTDWEARPLSVYQLEYAALDAAVLVEIFRHVRDHVHPVGVADEHSKVEWKSYIISIGKAKIDKKLSKEQIAGC